MALSRIRKMESYQHSGGVSLAGDARAIMLGGVAASLLGFVYAYAVYWIRLVYIQALLPVALGCLVGWVMSRLIQRGKVRNVAIARILGLAAGLVSLYMAWSGTLMAVSEGRSGLVLNPTILWDFMQVLYEFGFWRLEDREPLRGPLLALVWLVETGVVLGLATTVAAGSIRDTIYCEYCDQWTRLDESLLRVVFDRDKDEDALDRLVQGDFAVLGELPPATDDTETCIQLDLNTCPTCPRTNFASARIVRQGVDEKGEFTVTSGPVFDNRAVTERDVEVIREIAKTASESAEPFGEETST